jgi:hypothetical protein
MDFFETFIESEAAAALKRCEGLAAGWGLPVAVRDCRAVYGLKLRGCGGLFVPAVDAMKFGIPAGCGLAAVDVQQLRGLWDPVGRVVSVAAHEVAHAAADAVSEIEFPQLPSDPEAEPTIWTPSKLAGIGRPPWLGHDSKFLRAAAHVVYRLRCAGLTPAERWCFPPDVYGVSSLERYTEALQGEPERLVGVPIVAAMQTEAPEAFLKLWAADLARAAEQNSLGSSRRPVSVALSSEEPSSAQT